MRVRWDRGEGAVSYLTVILLVASVTASLVAGGVPQKVTGGVSAAMCRVAGDKDCDRNGTTDPVTAVSPPAAPSGGGSTGPTVPVPGSSAPAVDDES